MNNTEPTIGQQSKHPGGRPRKLTVEQTLKVYNAFEKYINTEDDPTIVGFCAFDKTAIKYKLTKDNIHDWVEFSELRKRAIQKQEATLLKLAGNGKYNPTVAIFRLKQPQHGYKDRVDSDITSGGEKLGLGLTPEQADQLLKIRAAENADTK